MHEALVEHLATVGANALAASGVDVAPSAALAPLRGDEAHVHYLARVVGVASTSGAGPVASLDARRLRRLA